MTTARIQKNADMLITQLTPEAHGTGNRRFKDSSFFFSMIFYLKDVK
jgi:hypothetical protein